MKKNKIPTGYLFIEKYSKGELETLSIGDYGKSKNIKADFLGFYNEIEGVHNGECLPLSEKWVITLSTQYGCPMKCKFCDVPKIKFGGNATVKDLEDQLANAIKCFDVKYTDRLNIHFARMGEPSFNYNNVFEFAKNIIKNKREFQEKYELRAEVIHPVFTTMLPKKIKKKLPMILKEWTDIKNNLFHGQAGLQLSINSTNDNQRNDMFDNECLSLIEISELCKNLEKPIGRKYCLNFALADGYETDGQKLAKLFDPEMFMVKITPIHNNDSCRDNKIETSQGYESYIPYKKAEESFKKAGFDVLVFVPSMDEEDGLVTCGNAILSHDEEPEKFKKVKIK